MPQSYDAVVIGAGLGGLTAAALLARAGRKVLLIERNTSHGGAATTYKVGDLVVEAALHETADPRDPREPKHEILKRIGVLDAVEWVPTGALYEVRGGPVGAPFVLPEGFAAARSALTDRFPARRAGIAQVLGEMERLIDAFAAVRRAGDGERSRTGLGSIASLKPAMTQWRHSLAARFDAAFGEDEGVKCALAANLSYFHDDPATLWWLFFASAQGGYLASGGRYIRGGSQRLSNSLRRAIQAAGGELLLRRRVTAIRLDGEGRPRAVVHVDRDGKDETEVATRAVIGSIAPAVLATTLPEAARAAFEAAFADRPLSTSLFAATFGLARPPSEFGLSAYSTFVLPPWMQRFADYAALAGRVPTAEPDSLALTIADYSRIESGFGGPPYPISVMGFDRASNWTGLDGDTYRAKRDRLLDVIVATLDRQFPGIATAIVSKSVNTPRSIEGYLNAPQGAIYGFAPVPPGSKPRSARRSPATPIPGLYLSGAYAGGGGFTGAIYGGAAAADRVLAGR